MKAAETTIPIATRSKLGKTRSRDSSVCKGSDYDSDELEFLRAVDDYKRNTGRAFPAWTEILAVFKTLGYRKVPL